MPLVHQLLPVIGFVALFATAAYGALSLTAMLWWRWQAPIDAPGLREPVTVLKPLCGAEPGLIDQLRSFCEQDYPRYEIVFGIRDPADPARLVVEQLAAEFPGLPLTLVCDSRQHGNNLKVSNLLNMLRRARHDILLISDSDARVGADYLSRVTAPLSDPGIGLVTSLYRAASGTDLWSRLITMYINEWYAPSVLLARMFGHRGYASGQTLCLRRRTLEHCGGLEALTDHLAEDHELGARVRRLGLQIVITPYPVTCQQHEATFQSLCQHELRWLRTLRVLAPGSFRWIFVTFCLPLGLAGLLLCLGTDKVMGAPGSMASRTATALFAVILANRLAVHLLHRPGRLHRNLGDLWLLPVRDLLLLWEWTRVFANGRVVWRGREFRVDRSGLLHEMSTDPASSPLPSPPPEQLAN